MSRNTPDESNINRQNASEKLSNFLKAKSAVNMSEFTRAGEKSSGLASGHRALDDKNDEHLIKHLKTFSGISTPLTARQIDDRTCGIREYIFSPVMQLILPDHASSVQLTPHGSEITPVFNSKNHLIASQIQKDEAQQDISVRSKFLENFQTLQDYAKKGKSFEDVKGFEKVIAACLVTGDVDFHMANVGVIKTVNEAGQDVYTAAKIDHGWAGTDIAGFRTSAPGFREPMNAKPSFETVFEDLIDRGYANPMRDQYSNPYPEAGHLRIPLSPQKLAEAIDTMRDHTQSFETLIKSRTQQLYQAGIIDAETRNFYDDQYTKALGARSKGLEEFSREIKEKYPPGKEYSPTWLYHEALDEYLGKTALKSHTTDKQLDTTLYDNLETPPNKTTIAVKPAPVIHDYYDTPPGSHGSSSGYSSTNSNNSTTNPIVKPLDTTPYDNLDTPPHGTTIAAKPLQTNPFGTPDIQRAVKEIKKNWNPFASDTPTRSIPNLKPRSNSIKK